MRVAPRGVKGGKIMSIETRLLNRPVSKGFIGSVAAIGLAAALSMGAAPAHAQVAGSQTIGVSQEELKLVTTGWSAKKNMLGKAVYNDKNEKIGNLDDLIVSPDKSVSFAIIGTGGFLAMGKHDVAIPVSHIKVENNKLVLPGATKDALKALPEFQYAKLEKK
jgi:sporulation protein YlmC with PRC-barrel domain